MKTLIKTISLSYNKKRKYFKKSLRKKRVIYNIKYSPKNTSQFLIKYHINENELDYEDFIPFGSMINMIDFNSENSTTDDEQEKCL